MWNISADYLTDTERYELKQHLIHVQAKMPNQPITVVVLGNPGWAIELKLAIPNAIIIYRKYFPNSDGDGDNSGHLRITPEQWYATYATEIPPSYGIYYYAINEPALTDQLITWSTRAAEILNQNGARGVFLNLSVGVPEKQDWAKANPLLREIAKRPKDLLIGLHEYGIPNLAYEFVGENGTQPSVWPEKVNGASWMLARYRELLYHCDRVGIPRPYIVFTEFGWDYIHAAANYQDTLPSSGGGYCGKTGGMWCNLEVWWRWWGATWEYYAYLQVQWAWNAIYRWDKEVLGLAFFCYGSLGRWLIYDAKLAHNFVSYMEQGDWRKKNIMPITPTHYIVGGGTNVRSQPNTTSSVRTVLDAEGDIVQQLGNPSKQGNYFWYNYRFVGGLEGWIREDVHERAELKLGVRLGTPYRTQKNSDPNSDDYNNDCGSAASAMLMAHRGVNKTTDEVSAKVFGADVPQHFNKFVSAVKEFGFDSEVRQGTHLTDIINALNGSTPMMTLVNYNELRGNNIPHFVVPVGYDVLGETLQILVHDPDHAAYVSYPHTKFVKAISNTMVQNNTPYQSMFLTTYTPPDEEDDGILAIVEQIETLLAQLKAKL